MCAEPSDRGFESKRLPQTMLEMAVAGRHRAVTAARGDGRRAAAGLRAPWAEGMLLAQSGPHSGMAVDSIWRASARPGTSAPPEDVSGIASCSGASALEASAPTFSVCTRAPVQTERQRHAEARLGMIAARMRGAGFGEQSGVSDWAARRGAGRMPESCSPRSELRLQRQPWSRALCYQEVCKRGSDCPNPR